MGARNPSYQEPVYWDRAALREETTRVFDICHGCRRCAQLCPSFGSLFMAPPKKEGEGERLPPSVVRVARVT